MQAFCTTSTFDKMKTKPIRFAINLLPVRENEIVESRKINDGLVVKCNKIK